MKALWFSLIIHGRNVFSLLAMTLDVSLESTLHRLMGLYWVIFVGFLTFGMRTMCVSLNFGGIIPWFKNQEQFW